MKKSFLFASLIIGLVSSLAAQDIIAREKALFESNLQLYRDGNYVQAEKNFALIVSRLPNSKYITASYLMLAKSQYKLNDYVVSIDLGSKFLSRYPKSNYRDDMMLNMANCYYRLNRIETAVTYWIDAIDASSDRVLKNSTAELVIAATRFKLEPEQRERILKESKSGNGKMLLSLAITRTLLQKNDYAVASQVISDALQSYPQSEFRAEAEELLAAAQGRESGKVRIALLLPLSGGNKEIGQALREGSEFAVSEYTRTSDTGIELVVRDYGQDLTEAMRIMREIARDPSIVAAYGPVENDISAACAIIADYEKIPLICPTATEASLTGISDYVLQLNTPVSRVAEDLASYGTGELGLKRFATLAPLDAYYKQMVDRFSETVTAAGGKIVTQEWYYPGDQDFNKQFMKIKRKGIRLVYTDSVMQADPETDSLALEAGYQLYVKEQRELLKETNTELDSADIPVTTIDGIFIPIYREDLQLIAPQMAYSNVQAQYFGNGDWFDADLLKKNKNYVNGIVFAADGFSAEESWEFNKFRNDYRMAMKATPSEFSMVGYDTFHFLLDALKETGKRPTRSTLYENLRKERKYAGVHRSIEIGSDRENRVARLLKYSFGQILPLN